MSQRKEQQQQKLNKETFPEKKVREELIKEVGKNLDSLIGAGIITRYHMKYDFCIDYATIRKLRETDLTVSKKTLEKMMYAMAYYLDCHRRKIEAEEDGIEKKQKLDAIPDLENKLVEIYGHAAQTALDLAKDGIDLRQIVKE